MYCRGKDTRRQIVQENDLHPVAHVQLLQGQSKHSCTGDALTDAYYCFSYQSRSSQDAGTILCGEHAAKDFLSLIGHPGLPLFNPLKTLGKGGSTATGGSPQAPRIKWDPTAKQLHDAIQLLIVCWSSPPGPALGAIKAKLEQFSGRPPFESQVKAVNTIVGKDIQQRSLNQMLSDLSKQNDIKAYDFSLLDAILLNLGISSNFT